MGLSENSDDHIFKRHRELCNNLNMDSTTTAQAWESYELIRQHYTLEGDPLHWLGCAIYVACRKSSTPTVGQTGSIVKGNCVNLTMLLRLCNFSLTQFFAKIKTWADMANMPVDFRNRIDRLERNFAVSCVVFKKYCVIFTELFLPPIDDQPRQHRSRKQRNLPCTPSRIFEFCWTLFVYIKGEFASCSDDLVTSFHLLLACCDMAFSNALMADRRDLLNPKYDGLPENFSSLDYIKPVTPPCIIDLLCRQFEGIVVDAKWVKEYSWKLAVSKLFDNETLHGDAVTLSDIFDAANFDGNMKSVKKVYEEYVLNVGEFDEKIFIAECRRMQLINRQQAFVGFRSATNNSNTDSELTASPNENTQYDDQIQQLVPATPLTGRKYLRAKDIQRPAPLSTATQSVIRLQTLLNGRLPEPSAELREIFSSCTRDPTEAIKNRVRELGEKFISHYVQQNEPTSGNIDLANNRLALSETLYYKLLENVVQDEKLRKPNLDITHLLEQDLFHQCLFACSIEIVIYSYNCQRKFPWILTALDLKGYYFYRIVEVIVRTKDQLSRDVVKHLNSIEEQILESISWENDSPLWQAITDSKTSVPSCEDTALPGQIEDISSTTNPNIKKIQTPVSSAQQSPITTASERFQSPIANSAVKKKLFVDPQSSKIKPGQSLLQNPSKTVAIVVVDDKGNKKLIPLSDFGGEAPSSTQPPAEPAKPKRNGSLALFFRKFYNLAGVRMEELCNKLNVVDLELKRKIFTCFEHCIIEMTDLMKDRHLDQILMCAVYVICRVSKNEKSFTEIMQCYRLQPQAVSHVYRSVLMPKHIPDEEDKTAEKTRSAPSELAGTSTTHDLEDRGDLIKFYNNVFIRRVRNYALRFVDTQSQNLHLSPLPSTKHFLLSSPKRRVVDNVYVRPYDQNSDSPATAKQYSYYFSRSPSKDLQNINMLMSSTRGCKRILTEVDDDDVAPIKVNRKLQGLIEDRLVQTKD